MNKLWSNVIIEWINCLNLGISVNSVEEIPLNDLFQKILALIISESSELTTIPKQDVTLTSFLKCNYPFYTLSKELNDVREKFYISLLLIHYCCLEDSRSEFINPLCDTMSENSQILLSQYFQQTLKTSQINRRILEEIIENIQLNFTTPTKTNVSNDVIKSPLMEFLKSPDSPLTTKFEKENKSLQKKLNLTQFEKYDLQEELDFQLDKNAKLEQLLTERQNEIQKLKNELQVLIDTVSPNFSNNDNLELNNSKIKIKNLERKIDVLTKHYKTMNVERLEIANKLRIAEEKCKDWKTKALEAESINIQLNKTNEFHLEQLSDLGNKFKETHSRLQELQEENIENGSEAEDSYIHNTSVAGNSESLATVIEIQLFEVKEENQNLKKQLAEMQKEKENFQKKDNENKKIIEEMEDKLLNKNEVKVYKNVLLNLIKMKECSQNEGGLSCDLLNIKRKLYNEENLNDLDSDVIINEFMKLENLVQETNVENENLKTKIVGLENEMSMTQNKILNYKKLLKNYQEDLTIMSYKNKSNEKIIKNLNLTLNKGIKNESKVSNLENKNVQLIKQNLQLKMERDELVKKVNDLNSHLLNFELIKFAYFKKLNNMNFIKEI